MDYPPDTNTSLEIRNSIEKTADCGFLFSPEKAAAELARTLLEYIFQDGIGGEADMRYRRGLQDTIAGVSSSPGKGEISDYNKARRLSYDAVFYAFIERLTYVANSADDS